ncbi:MAG: hypothetical protein A2730_03065 [Candidatus Staskawiczbacteria bacterium RIFCSPHIGHO2_01_FULL_39_25]|uniref:Four helix bundle protein n=1 Tax=Candidatus Staskawiczbacteria bacterium RIFCSPHIGHO2_01_FULL_39_25 TaxID=1802202 RepID=A0A1G2HQD2_9BACT|nr:MAG: hypothetical protein A2730_03065 [Candidatus Staskawiczbacteria bacterium RIFCSPHIGHO2_01_FULL_39_25]
MYKTWMEIHRNMERAARFGIGNKVDVLFLRILELLRKSMYAPINKKIVLLEEVSDHIDSFRFFFQLLWETKLVSNKEYSSFGAEIENLGKIVGGWKKGLLTKLPPQGTGERK